MIRYQLRCDNDHEFEGWFGSSADYDEQKASGLLVCAVCDSMRVEKAIMAPAVARTDRAGPSAAPSREELELAAAKVRKHIKDTHTYVGGDFAKVARDIHEGRAEAAPVYGEATREEARELAEDGVPAMPLPDMFAPIPDKKLN